MSAWSLSGVQINSAYRMAAPLRRVVRASSGRSPIRRTGCGVLDSVGRFSAMNA
jgi:hypothetical protein